MTPECSPAGPGAASERNGDGACADPQPAPNPRARRPHANYHGTDSFRYRIHDGKGSVDSAMVTVTISEVNDKPVAVADAATTTEEVAVTVDVTANDSDVDGDTVTPPARAQTCGRNLRRIPTYPAAGGSGNRRYAGCGC